MSAEDRLVADRYRLAEVLGTGGAAEVRRAWDTVLHRDVAIKLFRPGCDVADPRRFDNEIHTLAGLSHPGLVSVYDAGTNGATPFVVLQLVDGHTLADRIARGPMAVADVRRLGISLADALAHVHANGVVHRDVKPSNILLDRDGAAHLADFGLARLAGATRLTQADQLVGTAAYLAPEQVRGGEITPAVDIYALGLVLLECLTGRREYEGGEIEAAIARLHRAPVVPDTLPGDVVRMLSLMTSLSAGRRPTARECAAGLKETVESDSTRVMKLHGRGPVRLVLASAVVLAAAVGTAIAVGNDAEPTNLPPPATSAPPTQPLVAGETPPSTGDPTPQSSVNTTVAGPVAESQVDVENKRGKGKSSDRGKGKGG